MTLVGLLVVLVVVGLLLSLLNQSAIDPRIRTVINVIVILVVCLWLLEAVGLFDVGWRAHPRVHALR